MPLIFNGGSAGFVTDGGFSYTYLPPPSGSLSYVTQQTYLRACLCSVTACNIANNWRWQIGVLQHNVSDAPPSHRPCFSTCCYVCSYFTLYSTWSGASVSVPSGRNQPVAGSAFMLISILLLVPMETLGGKNPSLCQFDLNCQNSNSYTSERVLLIVVCLRR